MCVFVCNEWSCNRTEIAKPNCESKFVVFSGLFAKIVGKRWQSTHTFALARSLALFLFLSLVFVYSLAICWTRVRARAGAREREREKLTTIGWVSLGSNYDSSFHSYEIVVIQLCQFHRLCIQYRINVFKIKWCWCCRRRRFTAVYRCICMRVFKCAYIGYLLNLFVFAARPKTTHTPTTTTTTSTAAAPTANSQLI